MKYSCAAIILSLILNLMGSACSYGSEQAMFKEVDVNGDNDAEILFFIEKSEERKKNYLVGVYSPKENVIGLSFFFEAGKLSSSLVVEADKTLFRGELQFYKVEFLEPVATSSSTFDIFSKEDVTEFSVRISSISTK